VKEYPAIDVRTSAPELIYPAVDDYSPTAIEERAEGLRVFFASPAARDAARDALSGSFDVVPVEVPDDDWARRSQQGLAPILVEGVALFPNRDQVPSHPAGMVIVIEPSMGFGTGHHATTRLCLAALQRLDLRGRHVLDLGTGSGVLAIAAARLGAAGAIGIDSDPDAVQSARENLARNPEAANVVFEVADLATAPLPPADVVTANLTGALVIRCAPRLLAAVRSPGVLIVSGVMQHERDDVVAALHGGGVEWERHEDEWVAFLVKKP
jgi:ribosomal protein L11 methyltransferase